LLGLAGTRIVAWNNEPVGTTSVGLSGSSALVDVALQLVCSRLQGVVPEPLDWSSFSKVFLNNNRDVRKCKV
jgi:hypothetical protein